MRRLYHYVVNNVTVSSRSSVSNGDDGNSTLTYVDLCPRRSGRCVVDGQDLLFPADAAGSDGPPRCVRRSDRAAVIAAADAGIAFEAASSSTEEPLFDDETTGYCVCFLRIFVSSYWHFGILTPRLAVL